MASIATTIIFTGYAVFFFIFFMAVSWDPNQANEDKSQLRGETHKEISLVFLYRYSGHLSTSSEILTRKT